MKARTYEWIPEDLDLRTVEIPAWCGHLSDAELEDVMLGIEARFERGEEADATVFTLAKLYAEHLRRCDREVVGRMVGSFELTIRMHESNVEFNIARLQQEVFEFTRTRLAALVDEGAVVDTSCPASCLSQQFDITGKKRSTLT